MWCGRGWRGSKGVCVCGCANVAWLVLPSASRWIFCAWSRVEGKFWLRGSTRLLPSGTDTKGHLVANVPSRLIASLPPRPHRPSAHSMPPPQRQRYNAKARQSSVGGSSHKRRKQHPQPSGDRGEADAAASSSSATPITHPDSNREMIVPGSAGEEVWKAKEKMRKEVRRSA